MKLVDDVTMEEIKKMQEEMKMMNSSSLNLEETIDNILERSDHYMDIRDISNELIKGGYSFTEQEIRDYLNQFVNTNEKNSRFKTKFKIYSRRSNCL